MTDDNGTLMPMRLSRRAFVIGSAVLGASRLAVSGESEPTDRVIGLQADRVVEPLGLGSARPRLSWRMESNRRNVRQQAYQVRVASSLALLSNGTYDLWDSGRIIDSRSGDIEYAGKALKSRQRAYWSVQVWNELGVALVPSHPSWFEIGLLEVADWSAQWLAAENDESRADRQAGLHWIWGDDPKPAHSQKFRFSLNLDHAPARAELLIAARDVLNGVWLDGNALAYEPFRAGPVDFWRMVTIPMSLTAGRHVIQAEASVSASIAPASNGGALAAIVRLTFPDGTQQRLTTGPEWRTSSDTAADWRAPGSDDSVWPASVPARVIPAGWPYPAAPAIQLRRSFNVGPGVSNARLYITALGAYEPRLNGRKVGTTLLAPESTDYTKRVLSRTYDVTQQLTPGENVLGAIVGDGWYASNALFSSRFPFGSPPRRLLAQLEITYEDGREVTIATDGAWAIDDSPVLRSTIYDGEIYDARREQAGWDSRGFDARQWTAARQAETPNARVVPETSPPIRVIDSLRPTSITEVEPGVHVIDFGQNFAGWCRISGVGKPGDSIRLRFAERLLANGRTDQSNLRSAEGLGVYIFRGDAHGETYEPKFTYYGFRYVEVTGWSSASLPQCEGVVIMSDLVQTGVFDSSSALLNRIWSNTRWGQRSNFVGIPTDCPQRDERLGWMGDAQVFWDAAAFNMDVDAFTRRFMGDVRDGQSANGAFADYNPQPIDGPMRGSPGWADAGVMLPWTTWRRYGDTAIVHENWDAMARYMNHIHRANPDFVWRNERGIDYGDWLALDAKEAGDPTTPKDLVATAYWARTAGKMAQMARAIHRGADEKSFRELEMRVKGAYRSHFVNPEGSIGNGSQTGYVLSLQFGLLPERDRTLAARALVADIVRRGNVLSTGFLGTPHVLDVLADFGYLELVSTLLTRVTYPSWGYMISKGATTMWERWNSDVGDVSMNSFNHYAFGAIVGFFYRRLAGIDALEPGFSRISIKPTVIPGLQRVKASYDSVRGPIEVEWTHLDPERLTIDVTIPANTTALVHLPISAAGHLERMGPRLETTRAWRVIKRTSSEIIAQCGSGIHRFNLLGGLPHP